MELGPQQVPEEIADPVVRCRHAAAIARLHEGKVRVCWGVTGMQVCKQGWALHSAECLLRGKVWIVSNHGSRH